MAHVPPPSNPFGPSPFPPPPAPAGPRASDSPAWGWILGILAILGVGGILLCCGGFGAMFFVGTSALGPQILPQVQQNAQIREQIGDVQSCDWDFAATANEEGADTMVYNLRGTKGTAVLIAETESTEDGERIVSARLRLPDGREIQVVDPPADLMPSTSTTDGTTDGDTRESLDGEIPLDP